ENEPNCDQDIDRAAGNAIDGEDGRDLRVHCRPRLLTILSRKPLSSSWPGLSRLSRLGKQRCALIIEIAGTSPAMTKESKSRLAKHTGNGVVTARTSSYRFRAPPDPTPPPPRPIT